jgi:hypothetical protein
MENRKVGIIRWSGRPMERHVSELRFSPGSILSVLQVMTSYCIPNCFSMCEILLNFFTNLAVDCDKDDWSGDGLSI